MGRQVLWVALIVVCHLSEVYTLSIANTETAVSIGGSVEPHQKKLHAGTEMRYDDWDYWYRTTPRPQYRVYTYYSPLFWILVSIPIVFLVGSLILGAIFFFCKDTKPKLGFVVNSNGGAQGSALQQTRIAQPMQSSISLMKPGYVVGSNGQAQQSQIVQPPHNMHMQPKQGYVADSNGPAQQSQIAQPVQSSISLIKPGYVIDSNGPAQQGQITQSVQPAQKPFSRTKQGFVVSSNAGEHEADKSQNVATQQEQNPDYKPMYPEVKSVQKY